MRTALPLFTGFLAACGGLLGIDDDAPPPGGDVADASTDPAPTSETAVGEAGPSQRYCAAFAGDALCVDFDGEPLGTVEAPGTGVTNAEAHSPPSALETFVPASGTARALRTWTNLPFDNTKRVSFRLWFRLVDVAANNVIGIAGLSYGRWVVLIEVSPSAVSLHWWDDDAKSNAASGDLGAVQSPTGWNEVAFEVEPNGEVKRPDGLLVMNGSVTLTTLGVYVGTVFRSDPSDVRVRCDDLRVFQP